MIRLGGMIRALGLAARGESQPAARARDFSPDQGAKPQTYWSISRIWQHRAGGKDPRAARLDFCHGLLACALVSAAPPAVLGQSAPVDRVAVEVEQKIAANDFDEALKAVEALECGDDTECQTVGAFSIGYLYEQWAEEDGDQSKLKLAESYYIKALEKSPGNEQVRTNLAALYARQGNLAKVEELMTEELPAEPAAAGARFLFVGDLYAKGGDNTKALTLFKRAQELRPEDTEVHRRIFRIYRRESESAELSEHCGELVREDRERLAAECLERVIHMAWESAPELAEKTLLQWTELRSEAQLLTAGDLDRLPRDWTSPAFVELRKALEAAGPEDVGSLEWWDEHQLGRHVKARIFQARAAELRKTNALAEAADWLEAVRWTAPEVFAYSEGGPLEDRSPPAIDAMVDLSAIYHQLGEKDRVADLVAELFAGKNNAYLDRDTAAISNYHTVLGLIFFEQERWESEGYDNATFQLKNAVASSEKQSAKKQLARKRIPDLRMRLAETYDRSEKEDLAASTYFQASMDYLNVDDPRGATVALAKSSAAGYDPVRIASLENIVQVRRYIDEGAGVELGPEGPILRLEKEGKEILEPIKLADSFLFPATQMEFDRDFLKRQRFACLGDLTMRSPLESVLMAHTAGSQAYEGIWTGEMIDLAAYAGVSGRASLYFEQANGEIAMVAGESVESKVCGELSELIGQKAVVSGTLTERDGIKVITVKDCKWAG